MIYNYAFIIKATIIFLKFILTFMKKNSFKTVNKTMIIFPWVNFQYLIFMNKYLHFLLQWRKRVSSPSLIEERSCDLHQMELNNKQASYGYKTAQENGLFSHLHQRYRSDPPQL